MKFILAYLLTGLFPVLLAISDNLAPTILAVAALVGAVFTPIVTVVILLVNKKVNTVASKIDGLLKEKEKADVAIGEKKATDAADKTETDIQTGIDQGVKQKKNDQANRDSPPPQ